MATTDKRIPWIDMARGLCMMAILLFHTECYYGGEDVIPYVVYAGNAAITFFFVSGYLFVRPGVEFSVPRKLRSMATGLVLPYFIFTTAIAFPKAYAHPDLTLADTFLNIITGHATWFVPALIVTQLLFMLLLRISKERQQLLSILCALPFIIIALLYHTIDNGELQKYNLWCWQNAFYMLFFFYLGYVMRQRERIVDLLREKRVLILLLIIVILMKGMECHYDVSLTVEPIHVTSFTLLLIDGILFALLVSAVCLHLPTITPIAWTGTYSLYYYFICGGVPMMVGKVLTWCGMPYEGDIWKIIPAFIMVYLSATAIVWVLTIHKRRKQGTKPF